MHIKNYTFTPLNNSFSTPNANRPANPEPPRQHCLREHNAVNSSQISFAALYNVKPKNLNIDAEKTKLLRQIKEILDVETPDTDLEDIISNAFRKALGMVRARVKKEKEIAEALDSLSNNKTLSPQQKSDEAHALYKQFNLLEKGKLGSKPKTVEKEPDERIDYKLVNLFKTSVTEDNFNLRKVFENYYGDLKNISSIEELKEHFPKIKIPEHPQNVVSKKIENTLTRDFYEDLDELMNEGSEDKIFDFLNGKLAEYTSAIADKFKIKPADFHLKIMDTTLKNMLNKYMKVRMENGFSSVPEFRKNKFPQITDTDMKMLDVNFDDFVLSSVKKQYLEGQKPSEIKYIDGSISIGPNELKNSDYKFEKVSEKIKKLMSSADNIHAAQRDYDNFDINQFKNRLNFYANTSLGNNEGILENIIAFDICRFTKEDNAALSKFLRELDSVFDGKKSEQEALDVIRKNELRPKKTESLNEIDRQNSEVKFKEEQKKTVKLNNLKDKFDSAINLLYENNMNNIANTCSKYRPESLDIKDTENAEFIMEMIYKNIKQGQTLNKTKLESNIMRWDTFNNYKTTDSSNPIYKKSLQIAKTSDGKVDIDKAGQYIINTEIVESYPESLSFVRNREVLTKIMNKVDDKETAVRALSKFDNYTDLNTEDKTFIIKILDIFDRKDSADKVVLKHIIENDYANVDTSVNAAKGIRAGIAAKAKQQIIEKYKFPICIDYLADFEDALSSLATQWGTAGIKKTGRNNKAQEFKMEIKIGSSDARLFSSENNYYFDIFAEKGLH